MFDTNFFVASSFSFFALSTLTQSCLDREMALFKVFVLVAFTLFVITSAVEDASTLNSGGNDQDLATNIICCRHDEPLLTAEQVQAMDGLERISCNISRQEFYHRYELPRIPVILQGCADSWPALREWQFDRLAERNFSMARKFKTTFDVQQEKWKMATWNEIRHAIQNHKFFYIFDQLRETAGVWALKDEFEVPLPFRQVDLYANLRDFPPNYGPRRWFVMGSKTSGTNPHLDPSATDAWNTALQGYKWWILFPPGEVDEDELVCDPSCSASNYTTKHWYAAVGNNTHKISSDTIHVLQKPGETLYLPYGRVHSVYNFEDCIGVTENYASPADLNALWQAIVLEGTLLHTRLFFFFVLSDGQRAELLETSPYFDAWSQLHMPVRLVHLLKTRLSMIGIVGCTMGAIVWFLMSRFVFNSSGHNSLRNPPRRVTYSKSTKRIVREREVRGTADKNVTDGRKSGDAKKRK